MSWLDRPLTANVPDSGHVIHSDQPDLVADRLRTVVEAVRSR